MKAKEFAEKWSGDKLITFDYDIMRGLNLNEKDCEILSKYGLPEGASPYLNFEKIDMNSLEFVEEDYFYLGYTGNGDWICINTKSGELIIIEHDDYEDDDYEDGDYEDEQYEDEEECEDYDYEGFTFLNSSLEALYECLLSYEEFIQKRLKQGTDQYYAEVNNLKNVFMNIDKKAMHREDGFWYGELNSL